MTHDLRGSIFASRFRFYGHFKAAVVGEETSFNNQLLRVKMKSVKVGLFTWNLVPGEEQEDKRFLCCYAGRTAQVKSDPKGWILCWQCLTRIAPDEDWDGEIKWSTRLCEAAEAALRKAEEILLVEWQVSL
jgi:hypothetical protein